MEYPYEFRNLVPEAYNKYVVFNICNSEQNFFLEYIGALHCYKSNPNLSERNLVIQCIVEGKNIVRDYLSMSGVKEYAYDQKGIPSDYKNYSKDIESDSGLVVADPDKYSYDFQGLRRSVSFEFRWNIRRSALGYFKDKFSRYDYYVIGVDVSCLNEDSADSIFAKLDTLIARNLNSRILLTNTWHCEDMDLILDRYRDRIHFRTCTYKNDPFYRNCVDFSLMFMCDYCILCSSPFSLFSRVYNSEDMDYSFVDEQPYLEDDLLVDETK